MLLEEAVEVGH
jgi:hypothetical protein